MIDPRLFHDWDSLFLYNKGMPIEILIILSAAFSFISLAILLFQAVRKDRKEGEEAMFLRAMQEMQDKLSSSMDSFRSSLEQRLQALESTIAEMNASQRSQMALFFQENRSLNEKLEKRQKEGMDSVSSVLTEIRRENMKTMETVMKETSALPEEVRKGMDRIRTENSEQLDKMRVTVDEKLQSTLETRISKSFEQVTKNLVQAENILSDLMTPAQYVRNYSPKKGGSVVEFAIRLPGRGGDGEVFLPIDSKFPKEDFVRYSEAVAVGDETAVQQSLKDLRSRVLSEARDIRDKYIVPPKTTDFAILFVPTESLYAELLRIDGFAETLQDSYRVLLTGPTNFAALINSLQIGFKTLQVEKNTKRIWQLFKDLKTQFFRFGEDLEKTQSAIDRASDRISDAVKRNSMITGKLERIELPEDIEKGPQLDASYSDSTVLVE